MEEGVEEEWTEVEEVVVVEEVEELEVLHADVDDCHLSIASTHGYTSKVERTKEDLGDLLEP